MRDRRVQVSGKYAAYTTQDISNNVHGLNPYDHRYSCGPGGGIRGPFSEALVFQR